MGRDAWGPAPAGVRRRGLPKMRRASDSSVALATSAGMAARGAADAKGSPLAALGSSESLPRVRRASGGAFGSGSGSFCDFTGGGATGRGGGVTGLGGGATGLGGGGGRTGGG